MGRVVRVLPDEPAIAKTFDYLVPEALGDQVRVGTRVRIALGGRRVGGWIVAVDVSPPPGVTPRPLAKLSGHGPPADLIDLAGWAAWRWAGRVASFLRTANPDRVVTALPRPAPRAPALSGPIDPLVADSLGLPPAPPTPAPAPDPPGPATAGSHGSGSSGAIAGEQPSADPARRSGGGSVGDAAGGSRGSGSSGAVVGEPPGADSARAPADGSAGGAAGGLHGSGSSRTVAEEPGAADGRGAADRTGADPLPSSADADVRQTVAAPASDGGRDASEARGRARHGGAGAERSASWTAQAVPGAGPAVSAAGPWSGEGDAGSVDGTVGGSSGGPQGGEPEDHRRAVRSVVRMAPADDPYPVVRAAAGLGNALVICPTVALARSMGMRLRRDGVGVAFHPRDWAAGAAGATVVGTRAAAWAPVADLAAVVVLDEHDESHAQEQAPTWHARDVVAERARRAGVPCVLVSPCPSLEALSWGHDRLLAPSRHDERAGWPVVDVVDRRQDDPRTGLLSPRLVDLMRSGRRVVCVLNRTGRARLLACAACGELARCEACDAALAQAGDDGVLACPRCGTTRPVVCAACGATRLKLLRQGVSRVREELEALVGEPVDEVSSLKDAERRPTSRVVVGTEAVLHQVDRVDAVAFLDLDQELLAPRYRTVEQALALLARAARLVGGKAGGGRLLLQTRVPRHEVVQAVLHGDPARVAEAEAERRALLRFPPAWAMAEVSGPAAPAYIDALRAALPGPTGVTGRPPADPPAAPSAGRPPDLWSSVADGQPPDLWSTGAAGESSDSWSAVSDGQPFGPWSSAAAGPGAPADDISRSPGREVEILGPADGRWLVRAPDHGTLCDVLARVPRPPGRRLRLAVDPLRV